MKRDRSLRRIDDESIFIKNKQIEIVLLNKEIEQMQEEKTKLQKLIFKSSNSSKELPAYPDPGPKFLFFSGPGPRKRVPAAP
jgi:hypothetical protein